ncbi:MAG TPA: class I SAM-dependent methyltransferase [Nitrospira sp.]|jgi:SAM-dependent methyltransferase|nr:class I SAM-dependent methyltransferase [Nitrospira sp.]
MGSTVGKSSTGALDLERQPRMLVECGLCGCGRFHVICSAQEIAAQHQFLESFYRSRWSQQDAATATDRINFTQDYATALVACDACGLLYRNPRPAAQAVTKAYEREHYDERYLRAELETQRSWARTKVPLVAKYLAKTRKRSRPRVLEVGSFVGGFLVEGQKQGWDMVGVDPGKDVAAFCRERGLPIFQGRLEEARFAAGSFDAVVVWNTFDQLPDPRPLLEQAVLLLRSGGLLVLRVPNGACFAWILGLRRQLPRPLRGPFDVALACNNLLTFPYLYGYSAHQLERLTEPYGFRLAAAVPDQVVSTPPGQLAWWALIEERMIKTVFGMMATLWPDDRSGLYRSAPWLDCVFERACTDPQEAGQKISLGVIPVYSPLVFEDTGFKCPSNR